MIRMRAVVQDLLLRVVPILSWERAGNPSVTSTSVRPVCFLRTAQVAKVVIFLASGDAAMVTGSSYAVDGGFMLKA